MQVSGFAEASISQDFPPADTLYFVTPALTALGTTVTSRVVGFLDSTDTLLGARMNKKSVNTLHLIHSFSNHLTYDSVVSLCLCSRLHRTRLQAVDTHASK